MQKYLNFYKSLKALYKITSAKSNIGIYVIVYNLGIIRINSRITCIIKK